MLLSLCKRVTYGPYKLRSEKSHLDIGTDHVSSLNCVKGGKRTFFTVLK